jgi:hypothetical protein
MPESVRTIEFIFALPAKAGRLAGVGQSLDLLLEVFAAWSTLGEEDLLDGLFFFWRTVEEDWRRLFVWDVGSPKLIVDLAGATATEGSLCFVALQGALELGKDLILYAGGCHGYSI